MAFRGRGRGRGRGIGSSHGFAKPEPFVLFPEIENFPDAKGVTEEMALVVWSSRLQKFWNSSAYYLTDKDQKKEECIEIERYSDWGKRNTKQKHKLSDFIKCTAEYVPAELLQGSTESKAKESKPGSRKKVRWGQESDLRRLDLFEKLEQKVEGQDEKVGKEKKEDENEEEDDERIEEEDEEFSDDGDYNQNIDFDDDEDDFNMDDGNDDEGIY